MTGQINVNKIAARGGNTITINSGDALDVTLVKGEGNATTNLKQGLVKQWCHLDLNTENSVDDSFNTSSIADAATGKVTFTATAAAGHATVDDATALAIALG